MGGGLRFFLKPRVASGTHLVRILAKLQGGAIGSFIVRVRVVACTATRRGFLETLRALESLDDKCGLAEAAVLVEPFARKFAEGNHRVAQEECAGGGIVQFAVRPGCANRRLHVALSADGHEIAT